MVKGFSSLTKFTGTEKKQENYLCMKKIQECWAREMLKSGQKLQGRNPMDGSSGKVPLNPSCLSI